MATEKDLSPRYVYLTVGEVLEMHRQLIDEFGGIHGLRVHEAAALMESLAKQSRIPRWQQEN